MSTANRERLQYLHVQSTTQERVNSESFCASICRVDLVDVTDAVDRIKAIIAGEATNKQSSSQVSDL